MKRTHVKRDIARTLIAISAALYLPGLIPIYNAPFNGCGGTPGFVSSFVSGFTTLQWGCSDWPEFLRGFIFVSAAAVGPSWLKLPVIALLILLLIAGLGGVDLMSTGLGIADSLADQVFHLLAGLPILLGGVFAFLLYIGIVKKAQNIGAAA